MQESLGNELSPTEYGSSEMGGNFQSTLTDQWYEIGYYTWYHVGAREAAGCCAVATGLACSAPLTALRALSKLVLTPALLMVLKTNLHDHVIICSPFSYIIIIFHLGAIILVC